jgi:hypothetical protein
VVWGFLEIERGRTDYTVARLGTTADPNKDRHPHQRHLRCLQFNGPDRPATGGCSHASPSPGRNRRACCPRESDALTIMKSRGLGIEVSIRSGRPVCADRQNEVSATARHTNIHRSGFASRSEVYEHFDSPPFVLLANEYCLLDFPPPSFISL